MGSLPQVKNCSSLGMFSYSRSPGPRRNLLTALLWKCTVIVQDGKSVCRNLLGGAG